MSDTRKKNFDELTSSEVNAVKPVIWDLPDHIVDTVSGGNNFTQSQGGGFAFAQNFSCFAQNVGDFSQGVPPDVSSVG